MKAKGEEWYKLETKCGPGNNMGEEVPKERPPVLTGTYDLTLDEKGRLLIPAEVRRSIPTEHGESFYLVMGVNRVPWLWTEKAYEELFMQVPADMIPEEDSLAFNQMVFGMASKLTWDKQGRVLLPERTLKRASIVREVTLVGVKDHAELWDRAAWEARRDELEKRSAEVFMRARVARSNAASRTIEQG